jgi:tetratricopeptide (TPR) repeat protein
MQPRAFVVMPFGKKRPHAFGKHPASKSVPEIDFNQIYEHLFMPALRKAGYEVARADSEPIAGDIRTDMFFELVTADLVVADISILNANVYYELGVRHGLCPRGVFIVNASVAVSPPFDVAPDRRFSYDASPFIGRRRSTSKGSIHANEEQLRGEVERLAKQFRDASALDREAIGSPVYSHLPGLKPVDWQDIETSKAKYFGALQNDWLDCVKAAQANGHPGDILTLAMNAPTRMHEARILYEAAIALINLSRYAAAEKVLADVIRLSPDQTEAELDLAMVASHLGKTTAAEHQLRKILEKHKEDPRAADLLGQVFRHLWRLSWQTQSTDQRQEKARDASQLAVSAIHSFARAHRSDPRAYFAGFNALMLAFVLREIGIPQCDICSGQAPELAPIDLDTLKTLVRYTASNQQQQALEEGNYVNQFWCTTTLAGLHLIEGDIEAGIQKVREAYAIPAATAFQLQTFRDRLRLLVDLGVRREPVQRALNIIDPALSNRTGGGTCKRVFLWHGYGIDQPGRKKSHFPSDRVQEVSAQIRHHIEDWKLNSSDLAICGGMSESDILFAESCLEQDAKVRIMLRERVGEETQNPVWPLFASPAWHQRFHELVSKNNKRVEIWVDTKHLGMPSVGSGHQDPRKFASLRHKQWLMNTTKMEATQTPSEEPTMTLHGLFLWDKPGVPDDPEDSSYFIREVGEFEDFRGEFKVISLSERKNRAKRNRR